MEDENRDNKKVTPEEKDNPWEALTREEEEEERKKQEEQVLSRTGERTIVNKKEESSSQEKKRPGRKKRETIDKQVDILGKKIVNPLWLRVSEAAKIGGIQPRTIRRALKANKLIYKIIGNRYYIDLKSLILYMHSSKKLLNKLKKNGIGQYVEKWKK